MAENFNFPKMSIFERLRKWHEQKSDRRFENVGKTCRGAAPRTTILRRF
jgi:hypothetical protein